MRILVTGSEGQLGHDVVELALTRQHRVLTTDIVDIEREDYYKVDITDKAAVNKLILSTQPDVIIHCAAW